MVAETSRFLGPIHTTHDLNEKQKMYVLNEDYIFFFNPVLNSLESVNMYSITQLLQQLNYAATKTKDRRET